MPQTDGDHSHYVLPTDGPQVPLGALGEHDDLPAELPMGRHRRSTPLIGTTPTTGRVVDAAPVSVPANGTAEVGMPTVDQAEALELQILAAATGLELVANRNQLSSGFPIPFGTGTTPLKLATSKCYVKNTTGAAILCYFIATGHRFVAYVTSQE